MSSAWDELTPEDFAEAPVCGRERELSALLDAHDRVATSSRARGKDDGDDRCRSDGGGGRTGGGGGRSEIVVVTGPAGVGKSTLVKEFAARRRRHRSDDEPRQQQEEKKAEADGNDRYASGKFDQLGASGREPHAAIFDVVARLIRSGSVSPDDLARGGMDADCREFLGRIVPCDVRGAFQTTTTTMGDGSGGGGGGGTSTAGGGEHEAVAGGGGGGAAADSSALNLNRLKYSLRQFFRKAGSTSASSSSSSSHPMPLVVFLDDLQWADESSIDVVKSVASDPESKNVLFVLALRDDETLSKPLEGWMDDLEGTASSAKIQVGALSVDQANLLLSRVLRLSPPRTLPLSQVVHAKTSGNVLFLIQFVLHLQAVGLLRFSYEGCRWDWGSVEEIRGKTDVTGNVVEIVKGRIGRLPKRERRDLMVASCLGNAFRRNVLAATRGAWDDDVDDEGDDDDNYDKDDDDNEDVADDGDNDDDDDKDDKVADPGEECRGTPRVDESANDRKEAAGRSKKNPSSSSSPTPRSSASSPRPPPPVLETALKEGLLEAVSPTQLKFAHDKIQQAAYSLVPEERREELHYRIGRTLWELSEDGGGGNADTEDRESSAQGRKSSPPPPSQDEEEEEGREFLPFLAADQLNRGRSCAASSDEKIAIAELNLLVAEDAIASGAFILAAEYLDHALSLLDETGDGNGNQGGRGRMWTENYDLALRLCVSSAEAEHCRGDFDRSAEMCREVLSNARTLEDEIPAYFILVDSHQSAGRYGEALDVGIEVLGKLGEKCPRKPSLPSLARQFWGTHKLLKDRSNESLLDLPRMTNERKIAAMKFMSSLWLACVVSQSRTHLLLFTLRMVRLTLRWGLSELSPVGFAVYGMILCGAFPGSLDVGFRFGPLALDLQEALLSSSATMTTASTSMRGFGGDGGASRGGKEWSPRVNLFAYCGVKHFRTPLHDCPAPFVAAYNVAMSAGDIEFGLLSALHYCMFYYFSGMALDPIEKDMRAYRDQMREYKTETSLLAQVSYHQCVLNLMGKSTNTYTLTGESMDEDDIRRRASESKNMQALTVIALLKMQLVYYFGASDLYGETLKESLGLSDAFKGTHWGISQTYFEGLVSYAIARETKDGWRRRASLRTARRSTKKLRALVKCSACNCLHMYLLLKAERLSVGSAGGRRMTMMSKKGKADVGPIQKAYDAAIVAAGKVGFLQDKALSNELAGKALLAAGDEDWASHYLSRATESYFEWGAAAKAERLRADHGDLLRRERSWRGSRNGGGAGGGRAVVGMKSRRRFSSEAADRHRRMSDASDGTQQQQRGGERRRSSSSIFRRGSSSRGLPPGESGSAQRDRRSSSASTLSDGSLKLLGGT